MQTRPPGDPAADRADKCELGRTGRPPRFALSSPGGRDGRTERVTGEDGSRGQEGSGRDRSAPPPRPGRLAALGRSLGPWLAWNGVLVGALAAYAVLVEPNRIVVEKASFEIPGRAETRREGTYRIAFVSDFDLLGPPGRFERRVRDRINALKPDLVAIGGDIFGGDGGPPPEATVAKIREWLAGFQARDGAVIAWGEQESAWPELARRALPPNVREIDAACEVVAAGEARLRICGPNGLLAPLDVQPQNGGALRASWGRTLTVARYTGPGAEGWTGTDATVSFRFHSVDDGPGLAVLERPGAPGYRLRVEPRQLRWEVVTPAGADASGRTRDAGGRLEPGRRYRARVRVEPGSEGTVVRSRIWPADAPEPAGWPIEFVDTAPGRPAAGSVAIVAGGGWTGSNWTVFDAVEVRDLAGGLLLSEEFDDAERVRRTWDRPGSATADFDATIVVGHSPIELFGLPTDTPTAIDLYLAGHTHGGQVRLPFFGPLHLDDGWPRNWSEGMVRLAHGSTWLYVTRGVGSSKVPVRFLCPPEITDLTIYVRWRPPR